MVLEIPYFSGKIQKFSSLYFEIIFGIYQHDIPGQWTNVTIIIMICIRNQYKISDLHHHRIVWSIVISAILEI